jgi:hypothetical protein
VAQKLANMSLNQLAKALEGQFASTVVEVVTTTGISDTLDLNGHDIIDVGSLYIKDDKKIYFGSDSDAFIEYDEDGTNRLVISAPTAGIDITGSLYVSGSIYANEFIIDTVTTTVTNIEQQGSTKFGDSAGDTHEFTGSLYIADDSKIYFGANQDASVEYDEGGTNRFTISGSAAGIDITGSAYITGSILPGADDSHDLGSASKRWANIYTGDLHLANERGNWTVIEEEDYLTIRNNKTGKIFKLLMQEVSSEE